MDELTSTEKAILTYIERHPGCTMVDVAGGLAMAYQSAEKIIQEQIEQKNVTKNGAKLQRAGFIQWL